MRFIYTTLFYLAMPLILLRLWWRSRHLPAYRQRIAERFGYYPFNASELPRVIWVHAVSVGETMAALPLIKAMLAHYPQATLVVTTMTPTGAACVEAIGSQQVRHLYIPYDVPAAVHRFLETVKPTMGMIMETELWPNMLAACVKKQMPLFLLNARLSEKSARGYARIGAFTQSMLQSFTQIAAHAPADATRFVALGARPSQVSVTGSIKFDLELPGDVAEQSQWLREKLGQRRFIWIAASTHAGEEARVLAAHAALRKTNPQALLILVPRHPDRFNHVAALCKAQFVTQRRSEREASFSPETALYLGDTMGELLLLYAVADVAFVGGSLIAHGGHNLLEPAALAKPILTGPHVFNFAAISLALSAAHALWVVNDEVALVQALIQLQANRAWAIRMGVAAQAVVAANRGALAKQLAMVFAVGDQLNDFQCRQSVSPAGNAQNPRAQ